MSDKEYQAYGFEFEDDDEYGQDDLVGDEDEQEEPDGDQESAEDNESSVRDHPEDKADSRKQGTPRERLDALISEQDDSALEEVYSHLDKMDKNYFQYLCMTNGISEVDYGRVRRDIAEDPQMAKAVFDLAKEYALSMGDKLKSPIELKHAFQFLLDKVSQDMGIPRWSG